MNSGSVISIVLIVGLLALTIYLSVGLVKDIKVLIRKKKEKNINASNGSVDEQKSEENK